jgi:hypothetical protein
MGSYSRLQRSERPAANTTLDELVNKEMAKSGSFEIKVFSTNREYLDEIAWKSDPTGNWEARAWTDCSYVYVFNDIVAARRFFYAVRHHAEAETAIDVIF